MKRNILEAPFIKEMCETTFNMYRLGWDERNGGNISYLLDDDEVKEYIEEDKVLRVIPLSFEVPEALKGRYLLVTGTGKYFKNIIKDPENNLGIIRLSTDKNEAELFWGYKDGGKFTSELPAHLMSHAVRLSIDPKHKIIMHTHPTYTIVMGACVPVDDIIFTRLLWKNNTEAVVVFPEGIGVLPCMVCGTNEIGEATANKMRECRIVSWTNHGIYGAGTSFDETFGLIETVEKTATIYMKSLGHQINEIPDEVIIGIAKLWNVKMHPGVIKEK